MLKQTRFFPFDQVPISDSCWSLSTGPDGRIYAAACIERLGGGSAYITRYNEDTDSLDYMVEVATAVGDPPDSGRATQCKIHYCFAPSVADGILYASTHLSGPALGDYIYNPWGDWGDERKAFRGSHLLAFDTRTDEVLWHDLLLPHEGARCLAFDEQRQLFYAISYPRDHFFIYDLKTRQHRDLGRLGSVNAQAIFLDRRGRAFTSNQHGQLVRFDPDTQELREIPVYLPHEPYQSAFHTVIYDAVAAPAGTCIYGVTWRAHPHLFRYLPEEGEFGRIEDLGAATQPRDTSVPFDTFLDHAGGVVFGADGMLYYGSSRWAKDPGKHFKDFADDLSYKAVDTNYFDATGIIVQLNPETLERKEFAELKRPGMTAQYVSRGARDKNGDLFFGHVGMICPSGIFRLPMDESKTKAAFQVRYWG
ncbi:hypothetical protein JXJ21_03465 [candidate division KSB1 bacterium]|nr:hypothetical protein [candidate division KSB1 bacterium]